MPMNTRNTQSEACIEPRFAIAEDIGLMSDEMTDYWGQGFILAIL